MAVAHRGDHVSAIVAQVLDRFLAGDVPLVGHQDAEDEDQRSDDHPNHPALEASVILEGEHGPGGGHGPRCRVLVQILSGGNIGRRGKPNEKRVVISSPPSTSGGANMMLPARTIVLLVTMALATGGAAFGLHALIGAAGDVGTDYGLDTNGNGTFDWLVVEAPVALPQAGTWDISADLSSPHPPPSGSCGYGAPPPVGILAPGTSPIPYAYPIAYVYERYFFTDGTQTAPMAFG